VFLLLDPAYFNIGESQIGGVINDMLFYVIPFQMIVSLLTGFFYDMFGRKLTIIIYMIIASATAFLTPLTSPSLYPWYFINRIFFGCSVMGILCNPLINDYIKSKSRGRAHAIQAFGQLIGTYFGIGVLFNATKGLEVNISYYIAGAFGILFCVVLFIMIKEPTIKINTSKVDVYEAESKSEKAKKIIFITYKAMRSNPVIPICLLGGMFVRMQMSITLSFQLLWITSFVGVDEDMKDADDAKKAYVYLSIVTGVISLIFFYFLGKISDTLSPKILTPVSFLLRGVSLICIMFITDPMSVLSFFIWSLVTFAGLMMSVCIDGYFAKNLPKEIRGILISCMAFMSLLGKALSIKIGGDLFDTNGRNAPFIMIGSCDFVYLAFILLMIALGYYGNIKVKVKEDANDIDKEDQYLKYDPAQNDITTST
jgi:MFS family permease